MKLRHLTISKFCIIATGLLCARLTHGDALHDQINQNFFEKVIRQQQTPLETQIASYQTPQTPEPKKHTFWSLGSFVLSKDKAIHPNSKSRSRTFLGGYDYAATPDLKVGAYLSGQHGRSTSDYLAKTTTSTLQPIQARSLSNSYAIHPYASYNFNSWLSSYVAMGQGWGRTRLTKTRSNPIYGESNRQGLDTVAFYNTSSQDVAAYLSAVKSISKVTFQGQAGMIFTWSTVNKYTLYEPYTPPNTHNIIPQSRSTTRQANALIRTIYNNWENVSPYLDLGTICDIKRQYVSDSVTNNRIYRSRLSYQVGAGLRLFPKSPIQGGLSFFYINGRNQVESKGINIDIRYTF